jgi:hypothetical protein
VSTSTAEPQAVYKYDHGYMRLLQRWKRYAKTHQFTCFLIMFSFNVTDRSSSAIRCLLVDPIRGTATVEFKNGYAYEYTNVSRRAIANLLAQPNMSLGFWVNKNLLNVGRTKQRDISFYTVDGKVFA